MFGLNASKCEIITKVDLLQSQWQAVNVLFFIHICYKYYT
uniref:Uncharacterized protein n=1 Tax=Tetranychus urticae TaxID=32264 RepID=T1JSR0_TETUR